MPSFSKTVLLAVQAIGLSAFVGTAFLNLPAVATPLPFGMPLATPDYAGRVVPAHETARSYHEAGHNLSELDARAHHYVIGTVKLEPKTVRDNTANWNHYMTSMNGHYNQAKEYSAKLKSYAAQSPSIQGDDKDFQSKSAAALNGFHSNLLGFQSVLRQLGADRGLANYDKSNELETLLKNVVNLNKDTLKYVTTLVYNIPVLGPVLGPIVYEIKCILELLLDFVENLTDAILNQLQPLLEPLIGQANTAACASGISIVGLLCL